MHTVRQGSLDHLESCNGGDGYLRHLTPVVVEHRARSLLTDITTVLSSLLIHFSVDLHTYIRDTAKA